MSYGSVQGWQREATTRYITDPSFHAKIQMACQLTFLTASSLGVTLTEEQKASVLQAACYGALVAEEDAETVASWWPLSEIEESMRRQAEAFGMMLGKQEI